MKQLHKTKNLVLFIPTVLWILSYIFSNRGIHFIVDWLNIFWCFSLLVISLVAHKIIRKVMSKITRRLLLLAEMCVLMLILSNYQPLGNLYNFEDGYRINGYWIAVGFMDAGTVFELFQKNEYLPFLEHRIGFITNWEKDYFSGHGNLKPTIKLTESKLIITWDSQSDTFLVKNQKY
jgi:hypothetical protein